MLLFCSDQPLLVRLAGADRPTGTRSPQRDKDQEVSWCGDFDKLKEFLKSQCGEIQVERAKEPGAQVVKSVAMPIEWVDTSA